MVKHYFILRFHQLKRSFMDIPWMYKFFLLGFLILSVCGISIKASQEQGSLTLLAVFIVVILSYHRYRVDAKFLKTYLFNHRRVYLIEYFILSIPLLIGLSQSTNWHLILIYLVILITITYLINPATIKGGAARSMQLIPASLFEWKSNLRKYYYPIMLIWLLGMIFSYHLGAVIVSAFLVGLISLGFYNYCEPVSFLIASQQSAGSYLFERIKGLMIMSFLIYAPLLLLSTIFNSAQWYIPLIITCVLLSYQLYALGIKYAFYEPNSKSSRNTILLSLGALVLVLPFILPAIWLLTVRLYHQSIKKLNFYLDDFNS